MRRYWLDLFTWKTWQEFLATGGSISGFRATRWKTVEKMQPGEYLLCYLTGISRFIGVLEVTSNGFKDETPIWKDEVFPARVKVRLVHGLKPETAVPVLNLKEKLSCFKSKGGDQAWGAFFRGSPAEWKRADAEAVVAAIQEASNNPRLLPVDQRKLLRRPAAYATKGNKLVTVPEEPEKQISSASEETNDHTEIQGLLLNLGAEMGFDTWVARNDKSKRWNGKLLSELPNTRTELPLQFDDATNKTIELIDVLWLKGNSIVAAFEVESTTSIYSGLLRMSDLVSMQPNLRIPLYLVAPEERRDKVFSEINRPTFAKLTQPLSEICRFISFDEFRGKLKEIGTYLRFLRPEILQELSESCKLETD